MNKQEQMKNLEELLDYLSKYGGPNLRQLETGWYARIEMWVQSEGAKFTISSEFGHGTHLEACQELISRMEKVLKSLSENSTTQKQIDCR
jgi:hypothetical protein